ncbi:MAG: leucyl/phenylalanyl-tRNA--protein transferase [Treponematales bacterium]
MRSGPDAAFPCLTENERFAFPPPDKACGDVVASGGNLSPGMLLSAYEQGLFPWYNENEPVLWQSPDPRFVIFPAKLHVSKSMEKVLKRGDFDIAFDRDFAGVIRNCAGVERPGQNGTWITGDMIQGYTELHRLGGAHSAEAYQNGVLAGGCYGIRLGGAFFGESMFSLRPNASKAAFLSLARLLFADAVAFIDCQVHTGHLESLGGEEISRAAYLALLNGVMAKRGGADSGHGLADRRGSWEAVPKHGWPRGEG